MIIATHSGKFHADDVWAVAVLDLVFPDSDLVRTRDPEVIAAADEAGLAMLFTGMRHFRH